MGKKWEVLKIDGEASNLKNVMQQAICTCSFFTLPTKNSVNII